jgi:DNA-directed RNA polymerase subunit RPC12/RpoP
MKRSGGGVSDYYRTEFVCAACGHKGTRIDKEYDFNAPSKTHWEGFETEAVPNARPWKDEAVRPVCKCGSRKIVEARGT